MGSRGKTPLIYNPGTVWKSSSRACRFIAGKGNLLPIEREPGCVQEPVWAFWKRYFFLFFPFRVPCVVNIFQSMTNKMQRYTVLYFCKLLCMFRADPPPTIRSITTVRIASGICQTVTATCRYRGRVETAVSTLSR